MKRIILFTLALLFTFSTIGFAQKGITYEVDDSFIVTFPETWEVKERDYKISFINLILPNHSSSVYIYALPISNIKDFKSLDDMVVRSEKDKVLLYSRSGLDIRLQESSSLYIDNHEARRILYSIEEHPPFKKTYHLEYKCQYNEYIYSFIFDGNYDDLETDQLTINDIIDSCKLLNKQENIHGITNIFTVDFPEDWTVKSFRNLATSGISPNELPKVTITFFPMIQESLNEYIDRIKRTEKESIQLEDSQNLYIDNREARLLIYSGYNPKGVKSYYINCYVYGDQNVYYIWSTGNYDDLETDLKTFDKIISSIKILK
ncbi:hypothetical protein [Pelosinus sp. UFO1]|uniref:hypothetical protein n=1 Tax=Pelosinus sp. UFO1 TaxID=484770 RepID=UPI0004D0D902|nr:hypothetical protein [Pelosinus sp. UFO1]AIF51822.1 hypothetical protein UFO1_2275 [Pelosinus sp. UFO1]